MDASQRGKLLNNLADLMERDRYMKYYICIGMYIEINSNNSLLFIIISLFLVLSKYKEKNTNKFLNKIHIDFLENK